MVKLSLEVLQYMELYYGKKKSVYTCRVVGGNLNYCVVACNAATVIAKSKGASQAGGV